MATVAKNSTGRRGGSKPGERRGGRKKGTPNRATAAQIEYAVAVAKQARETGLMPLDIMLSMLRDEALPMRERFKAAVEAAPYLHPRLAAVEVSGDPNKPVHTSSRVVIEFVDADNDASSATGGEEA